MCRIMCITSLLMFGVFQYKTSKEGSVMGVTVSRIAMLSHCQALSQACNYSEGEQCYIVSIFMKR